jgi:hypothetical protein
MRADIRMPSAFACPTPPARRLQLANFWQDVASDFDQRDRIYIPQDAMRRFGVTEATIAAGGFAPGHTGVSSPAQRSGGLRALAL